MGRYALTDPDGTVTNVIVWDGEATYPIAEGHKAHKLPANAQVEPGGRRKSGGGWERAPRPDDVPGL